MIRKLFIAFQLSLLTLASASGAVLRVPEDFADIQSAINAASVGDTVDVAPGVYNVSAAGNVQGQTYGTPAEPAWQAVQEGIERPRHGEGLPEHVPPSLFARSAHCCRAGRPPTRYPISACHGPALTLRDRYRGAERQDRLPAIG